MNDNETIRVLVAEDDFLVKAEVVRILSTKSYEIVGLASSGREALEMTASLKPDVILMDIKMPELNGLEATRQIQEKWPTPVVILTAHESRDLVDEASKVGAGAYLTKPLRPEELERALTIAMARHNDLMQLRSLNHTLETKNSELASALAEIKTLRDILPICSFCKKIRDDQGYWNQVEQYISDHTGTKFSHGICDDCMAEHYPEFGNAKSKKGKDE